MANGEEVLHELGGAVGRYLSELYHRVEELERKAKSGEAHEDSQERPQERPYGSEEA